VQTTQRWIRWPAGTHNRTPTEGRNGPIAFGGDYNPEQWSEDVWQEDVRLMQEAGVNLVTVGVFSWARLQPTPDTWEFEWLDRVLDLLHEHGIAVDLATATASPPAWLTTAHPEMLPVDRLGTVLHQGGRQAWSPSSVVYREHSLRLVEKMAERYASHPALSMWHVSNELGCHNGRCYSELSAQGFRRWLRERYTDLDTFNRAWATDFWSQHYSTWEEIEPPRIAPSFSNPTQQPGFREVLLRRVARPAPGGGGGAAAPHPGCPGHDQLHGHGPLQGGGLRHLGGRTRPGLQRPLHDGSRPRGPRRAGVQRRPHPWPGRWPTLDAFGVVHQCGELATRQHGEAGQSASSEQPYPCRSWSRRGLLLPMARLRSRG